MTMIKPDICTIEIDARHVLRERLAAGDSRRQAIVHTRDRLMALYDITRSDCELLCWKAFANYTAAAVPTGTFIDLSQSSSNLLVIRTPQQKIIFTLFDLMVFAQESQNPERTLESAAESVITATVH